MVSKEAKKPKSTTIHSRAGSEKKKQSLNIYTFSLNCKDFAYLVWRYYKIDRNIIERQEKGKKIFFFRFSQTIIRGISDDENKNRENRLLTEEN